MSPLNNLDYSTWILYQIKMFVLFFLSTHHTIAQYTILSNWSICIQFYVRLLAYYYIVLGKAVSCFSLSILKQILEQSAS